MAWGGDGVGVRVRVGRVVEKRNRVLIGQHHSPHVLIGQRLGLAHLRLKTKRLGFFCLSCVSVRVCLLSIRKKDMGRIIFSPRKTS